MGQVVGEETVSAGVVDQDIYLPQLADGLPGCPVGPLASGSSALTVWARRPRARIPNPRRPTPKECELQRRHPLPRGRRPKPWSVPIRGPLRLPGRLCLPVVSLFHLSEMARTAFQAARRHTKPRACVVVHYPEQSLPSYTLPKKKEGLLYARLCTKIVGDHEDRRAHLFDFGRILFIGRTLAGL